MLDDLFSGLFDIGGGDLTKRKEFIIRLIIGIAGVALSIAGIVHMVDYNAGLPFRLAGAAIFICLACFCGFNIAMQRKWRWPGRCFVLSFVGIFVVRIIFGA